jgi:predicted DNA-binding helix-hairpin-helix protein
MDVNTGPREMLLRVPDPGPKAVDVLPQARRVQQVRA